MQKAALLFIFFVCTLAPARKGTPAPHGISAKVGVVQIGAAQDGLARAVRPAHTLYDGDTMFCLATGTVRAPADAVEAVAAQVVARAIATGVRAAQP